MTKIENREQYEWALSRIEALVNDVTEEMPDNDPKKMEYCILSNLLADYSDVHFDLGTPTLQECLKERMFEQGLSQKWRCFFAGHKPVKGKRSPFRKMQPNLWTGSKYLPQT